MDEQWDGSTPESGDQSVCNKAATEWMRSLTACVYVCEGNSLEEVTGLCVQREELVFAF